MERLPGAIVCYASTKPPDACKSSLGLQLRGTCGNLPVEGRILVCWRVIVNFERLGPNGYEDPE